MTYRFAWLLGGTLGPIVLGCSNEDVTRVGDQPDDNALTALGQSAQPLETPCQYDASPASRQLTVTLAAGEAAVLENVGGFVQVNAANCTIPVPSAEVLRVLITGASADESVTLDLRGGVFAFPTAATPGLGFDIDLGAGTDALDIVLGAENDNVSLGADGLSIINAAAPQSDAFVDIASIEVERLSIQLGEGNDTLSAGGSVLPALGGPFHPVGTFLVHGEGGDDTFFEGALDTPGEVISGGSGNDVIDYSARLGGIAVSLEPAAANGPDTGGPDAGGPDDGSPDAGTPDAGSAVVSSANDGSPAEGDDIRDDVEVVLGGAGNDVLTGGSGDDVLVGGAGDDSLGGGLGRDRLVGGNGRDWFFEGNAPNGSDVFSGGPGLDTVDYSGRLARVVVSMDGAAADDGDAGSEADDVAADIENLLGGAGNDVLTGNASNNVLSGGPGDDIVAGGAGYDTLSYASAASGVSATLADLSLGAPSTGNGTVGENDTIDPSIENLTGSAGSDRLVGNQGPNELVGGAGEDTLIGGAGDDVLEGGPLGSAESNRLECGPGDDIGYAQGSGLGATALDCEL